MVRRHRLHGLLVVALAWAGVAEAHDRDRCPPVPMLEKAARAGKLDEKLRGCLTGEGTPEDRAYRDLLLWWDDVGKAGAVDGERAAAAVEIAGRIPAPDPLLDVAEKLASDHPAEATAVVERVLALGGHWKGPGLRAQRTARLGRLIAQLDPEKGPVRWANAVLDVGLVGGERDQALSACLKVADEGACTAPTPLGLAEPPLPDADDMVPCQSAAHLWLRGRWGAVYTTERDCLANAVRGMPEGEGRDAAVRLSALHAVRHADASVAPSVLRSLASLLPGDPHLASLGWTVHTAAEDPVGAAWWASWLASTAAAEPPGE